MLNTCDFRLTAAAGIWLSLLAAALPAQELSTQNGAVVLRSDTRVVEVDVTVRDAQGKPVDDLNKDDFTITDDRKPRAFAIFSVTRSTPASNGDATDTTSASPAPPLPPDTFTNVGQPAPAPKNHSTIILIDAVNAWFDNVAEARKGVLGMLTKVPADEKIALYVVTKHKGLVILQDYTLDRARLLAAMDKYIPEWTCSAPPRIEAGDEGMRNPGPALPGNPIFQRPTCKDPFSLQPAVDTVRLSLDALAKSLRSQPGRKSVFWMTQGFPPTLFHQDPAWDKTVSALNDANIAVNTVDVNGLFGPPRFWGPGGTLTMIQLAERTGGTAYHHRNDLDVALEEGIAASRSGYTLGFYLTDVDNAYHDLKVNVDRPNMQMNYRQGYYAVDDQMPQKSDLSAALLNPANSTEIGIIAKVDTKPGVPRGTLNVQLRLQPDSLSLANGKDARTGKVSELFLELNADGKEVGRISAASQFDITPDNQAAFDKHGILIAQTLELPPEAVKLSIVVQDTQSGKTGSLTVPLEKLTPSTP